MISADREREAAKRTATKKSFTSNENEVLLKQKDRSLECKSKAIRKSSSQFQSEVEKIMKISTSMRSLRTQF